MSAAEPVPNNENNSDSVSIIVIGGDGGDQPRAAALTIEKTASTLTPAPG